MCILVQLVEILVSVLNYPPVDLRNEIYTFKNNLPEEQIPLFLLSLLIYDRNIINLPRWTGQLHGKFVNRTNDWTESIRTWKTAWILTNKLSQSPAAKLTKKKNFSLNTIYQKTKIDIH